jgi:hypothetical protein
MITTPAIIAFVVAIAGMMLPAIATIIENIYSFVKNTGCI